MGVVDSIKESSNIALDTNIFILALDKPGLIGDKARNLLDHIRIVNPRVSVSVLVLEEFFVKVYKQKREKETAKVIDFIGLGGNANLVVINEQVAILSAKIRAEYGLRRAPDALHLASAIEAGARVFITTDRRLPRKIGKLTVKVLG